MAEQDIRHYQAPNGVVDIRGFPVTASQSFRQGEPVVLTAAGTLSECVDDPGSVLGIAAHRSTDVDGADLGVGTQVAVYVGTPGQTFITKNFATNGAGNPTAPTLARIGDLAGFTLTGAGVWLLDIGTANKVTRITGVQDVDGRNLSDPNVLAGTGVWVLFEFI